MNNLFNNDDLGKNEAKLKNTIDLLLDERTSIDLSLYIDILNYENHYNIIQNKYKGISTTWMVASFIAMGYLLSGFETGININVYLEIMFLCLISACGVFLLWYLDSEVYYKLIESIFEEGLKLEKSNPNLTTFHKNLEELHNHKKDPLNFHRFYYSTFVLTFILISILSLLSYIIEVKNNSIFILLSITSTIAFLFVRLFFHRVKTR